MAPVSLPPGFRFHPSDEELVGYYLKRKVHGRKIELDIIPEVDLYKFEPWDLPNKSFLPNRDLEWYFFSPRDKKYPNGTRTNRATEAGYWKATGKDRKISTKSSMIGTKKTLVFYGGRAPQGRRTDWVMHEYRLDKTQCEAAAGVQDAFVLCRVFKKNGIEPRIGSSNEPSIQRNAFPSVMNSSFSDKMTKPDVVEDLSDKSYPQVKQEEAEIQADTTLQSETSFERLNDRTDNSATLNQWLEFLLDDSSPSYILASPANARNDLKVSSMIGGARLEQESLWPMFKIDNFSQGIADLSFNQFTSQIEPTMSHTTDACFEEEDVLDKILKVAQAGQNEDTHNEHPFFMAKLSGNLVGDSLQFDSMYNLWGN